MLLKKKERLFFQNLISKNQNFIWKNGHGKPDKKNFESFETKFSKKSLSLFLELLRIPIFAEGTPFSILISINDMDTV